LTWLQVVAESSGTETVPPSSASASLVVDVTDVNDNAPAITLNALTETGRPGVVESAPVEGTFVAHVAVTDADSFGDNSRTACRLVGPAPPLFRLQQLVAGSRPEYKLVTAVPGDRFDRETTPFHRVVVSCRDFGTPSLTSSVDVTVDVIDANDNTPRFANESFVAWLPVGAGAERRPELVELEASDADEGPNAELRYSIRPLDLVAADCIGVNATSGVLSADVERCGDELRPGTELKLVATVSDGGSAAARSSTAAVVVRVVDVDAVPRPPRFANSSYDVAADCDLPAGSRVATVSASAADPRDDVRLQLRPPTADVRIDSSTGAIVVAEALPRETSGVIETTVVATAARAGAPAATSSAALTVHVRCGLPRFLFPAPSNSTVLLPHDAAVEGAVVVLPEVKTRPRSAPKFTLADSSDNLFQMDPLTGVVRLLKTPPAAVGTSAVDYRLTLRVADETGAIRLS